MKELIQYYCGFISAILFAYCICFKKINKAIGKISSVKLVKIHMYAGICAAFSAIIHSYSKFLYNIISFGTGSLILMIIIGFTGAGVKYSSGNKRRNILCIHKICCVFCVILLFFHAAEYFIMEL